ncbi:helix-turn-helix domain-containing protein [Aquihabitans daechungensis]|uniref:helix-turn-helix domain-containing protein n=1 Tax=Aquihabitans daechungensis TaxID=1052257 RepID=UPI003BA2364C
MATEFGARLRGARQRLGLTLKDVSEKSGSSIAYLSDLERGLLKNPTLDTLTGLASALGVSLNELLGVDESEAGDTYPAALERFADLPQFLAETKLEAKRRKISEDDLRRAWLRALSGIDIYGIRPKSESDYLFVWEAIRRVVS